MPTDKELNAIKIKLLRADGKNGAPKLCRCGHRRKMHRMISVDSFGKCVEPDCDCERYHPRD